MIKYLMVASLVVCFFATDSESSQIYLQNCGQLTDISSANYGDVVILPNERCEVSSTIAIPNGISVLGNANSVLSANFSDGPPSRPIFKAAGSKKMNFSDFTMELGKFARGFFFENSSYISISNLIIKGNLLGDNSSSIPIYASDSNNITISQSEFSQNFGGVYAINTNSVGIYDNTFRKNNFGNVVVSGSFIDIVGNTIAEPGYPGTLTFPSGDGITLSENSSNINIINNTISYGYCYLIQSAPGVVNLQLRSNTFSSGTTVGVYLVDSSNTVISNNRFLSGKSYGLGLIHPSNVSVTNNKFDSSSFFAEGAKNTHFLFNTYQNENLDNFYSGDDPEFDLESGNSRTTNARPVACISPQRDTLMVNSAITLSGGCSADSDNDALQYSWDIGSKPASSMVNLDSSTGVDTMLTPDVPGIYVVSLKVNDGKIDSIKKNLYLNVASNEQISPIAVIGTLNSSKVGDLVLLDGCSSISPDDSELKYAWSVLSRPDGSLNYLGTDGCKAHISLDHTGSYTFGLVVSSTDQSSLPATVHLVTE